jgi:predicted MFS family arabinose efflux permease
MIYVANALASVATILYDKAYLTAVPAIVSPAQLLTANSAVQASTSTAELAGPPLAGFIFQAIGASYALLGDALSFIVSVVSLALIPHSFRAASTQAAPQPIRASIWHDIGEGMRFVWKQPVLRWSMLLIAVSNFCSNAVFPLWLFRMQDHLHYSAGLIGLILAFMAVGGIAGSFVAGRFRRWFGMLPIVLVAVMIEGLAYLAYAFATQPWLFMLAALLIGALVVVINVNILTLRQSITPDEMMGRMQSVARVIAWSLIPAGALVGTALAGPVGLTPVIVSAGALVFLVALGMFLSPIRKMG